jgi:glycosyltransferase involved in cell wall biosynthesis
MRSFQAGKAVDSPQMNILINAPDLHRPGGVANHYKGLQPHWRHNVDYYCIGARNGLPGWILLPWDLICYFFRLALGSYQTIVLNPSLLNKALARDALFLAIASLFKVRKVVFFHGWDESVAKTIQAKPAWFARNYGKADALVVLSSSFKMELRSWGIKAPIHLATTKVDHGLVEGFSVEDKAFNNTLLFLARIEENKGIFVTLESFRQLKGKFPHLRLLVAGDGSALAAARECVRAQQLKDVEFLGNLSGEMLSNAFRQSDIYVLPTWHGEGMPTSVLEAMAFGLPVVTRPVGGINDFFEEDKMGALVSSTNPDDFSDVISRYLASPEKISRISRYNAEYARENFLAAKVAGGLEAIMEQLQKSPA